MIIKLKPLVATFAVAALIGCTTTRGYDGPAQPKNQVAVVKAHGVRFHRVNGKPVSVSSSTVELLPGRNEIELTVDESNYVAGSEAKLFSLPLAVEAGKSYAVTGRRGNGRLCAWPIVPETGDPSDRNPAGCITWKK